MAEVVVTFVNGNDAAAFKSDDEPLLKISISVLPRVGEAVRLPVKHSADTAIYRVRDVLHIIVPMDMDGHEAVVAVD